MKFLETSSIHLSFCETLKIDRGVDTLKTECSSTYLNLSELCQACLSLKICLGRLLWFTKFLESIASFRPTLFLGAGKPECGKANVIPSTF